MADKLVEINEKHLQHLLDFYTASNKLGNEADRVTIESYMRWHQLNPNLEDINFLPLNGDISNGTFIITVRFIRNSRLFFRII